MTSLNYFKSTNFGTKSVQKFDKCHYTSISRYHFERCWTDS